MLVLSYRNLFIPLKEREGGGGGCSWVVDTAGHGGGSMATAGHGGGGVGFLANRP